jgi:7,8-dihydropterin-6-yl-methyl-4-(beta-D-ribofuranosyl)aminobenzene 5'-phosphate synthase
MIGISVLLENSAVAGFEPKHGLSIAVDTGDSRVLVDVGPDATFLDNARRLRRDIGGIRTLLLSHSHVDHGGGLDAFCAANGDADVFLFDDPRSEYVARIFGPLTMPVGLRCAEAAARRVKTLSQNRKIDARTWFIRNACSDYPKPRFNKALLKKVAGGLVPDDFAHEGIVVVDDGGLVVFNSCSHSGIYNTVASVKQAFGGRRIRSYVGGLHYFDPITKRHEGGSELDRAILFVKGEGIKLYAGHCTGEYGLNYLAERLGGNFTRISTGSELKV